MITICIPIYNYNVTALVTELCRQTNQIEVSSEIILIDDCSSEKFRKINKEAGKTVTYIQLEENIGRSRIRNLFLNYSKYDNLLFLDCDSLIISEDFVIKYIETIKQQEYAIICGGRIYVDKCPGRNQMLRWKYGIKKESQPLNIRLISPNKSFMTNNFLVQRKVFKKLKFDERINEYGHEDTLFGYMLKKNGYKIKHIDNPVLNGDIEDNADYLIKTEKSIINLLNILKYVNEEHDFIKDVTILNFYKQIESKKMLSVLLFFYKSLKPILRILLKRGYVNLLLFDFYKIGFLIQHQKAKQQKNYNLI